MVQWKENIPRVHSSFIWRQALPRGYRYTQKHTQTNTNSSAEERRKGIEEPQTETENLIEFEVHVKSPFRKEFRREKWQKSIHPFFLLFWLADLDQVKFF